MSEDLREEIARVLAQDAEDYIGDSLQFAPYLYEAGIIMPIIERVRDEAYARGINDAYLKSLS